MQAVPVAAGCQRPGEQARPAAGAGAQACLGVIQPEQVGQEPGQRRAVRFSPAGVQDGPVHALLNPEHQPGDVADGAEPRCRVPPVAQPGQYGVQRPQVTSRFRRRARHDLEHADRVGPVGSQNVLFDSPPCAGVSATRSRPACSRKTRRSSSGEHSFISSATFTVSAHQLPARVIPGSGTRTLLPQAGASAIAWSHTLTMRT